MKTSKLNGLCLAHWVAMAEGLEPQQFSHEGQQWVRCRGDVAPYEPHLQWNQGGPIIEREAIHLTPVDAGGYLLGEKMEHDGWLARCHKQATSERGDTPLVAAMRANVARVYGEELPDPA